MADNSLKIKKSLSFTPQATPPANPQIGDIYLDSTQNKLLQYNGSTWVQTGNDLLDVLLQQNFNLASLTDFTQTGLELITNPTIQGAKSARLIHQAATTYSFQETKSVDRKYRGKNNTLSMIARSSASSANVTLEVTGTNGVTTTTLLSSTFTTGQITASVFNTTSGLPTVTVTDNAILNQIIAGATITGSGIPTGTTVLSVGSSSITLSANATATATGVGLKVSSLPKSQNFSFEIPADYNSITYKVSALAEAGLPETYVDDIVIELTEMALQSASITVPKNNDTDWVDAGLTAGDFVGFGTPTNIQIETRREGGDLLFRGKFTTGTTTGVEARMNLKFNGQSLTSAGSSVIPSLQQAGDMLNAVSSALFFRSAVLIEPSVGYVTFSAQTSTLNALTKRLGNDFASSTALTINARTPIAGWSANETETKTIPLSSSVIVTEPDSHLRITGFPSNENGSTATKIVRVGNGVIQQSIGDAFQYLDDSVNGTRIVARKEGLFRFGITLDGNSASGQGVGFSLNTTDLTSDYGALPASEKIACAYEPGSGAISTVYGEAYLRAGDVVRPHRDGTANSTSALHSTFTASYLGSTKILNPSSDQKVEIPTHELRFEGASARGSAATAIVKFDTLAKIKGDGFEVINTAADGTVVKIKKKGKLSIDVTLVSLTVAVDNYKITKNQSNLTTIILPASEVLATQQIGNTASAIASSSISAETLVEVGDVIRIASSVIPSSSTNNMLSLTLQEQSVAVALQNVAPRWDDSDSCISVNTSNGLGTNSGNKVLRFANLQQNFGSAIEYISSSTLGDSFLIKENGLYDVSFTNITTLDEYFCISVNNPDLTSVMNSIPIVNVLANGTTDASNYPETISTQVYLSKGDIVRAQSNGASVSSVWSTVSRFSISKVGKTQGTVDVTPFVQIPQNEVEAIEALTPTSTFGSTSTSVPVLNITRNTNKGIIQIVSDSTNGTSFRVLKDCEIKISASALASASGPSIYITRNATGLLVGGVNGIVALATATSTTYGIVSTSLSVNAGDVIRFQRDAATLSSVMSLSLTAEAISPSIATPTEQVSSDTIPFVFKATAITDSDPVGTFNTFVYGTANSNSATYGATAPTQSVSDMNINGIRVFAKPFTGTSTAAQPARVDIKIGKGLKSKDIVLYGASGKSGAVPWDLTIMPPSSPAGTRISYSETTGVLSIDAANDPSGSTTGTRTVDNTASYTSGYFVFNASKSPSLVSIPNMQQRVAYLSDVKPSGTTGGTSISGAQTRTLNTLVDPTGFVTSLASNQFTLPAGTYEIYATAPAYRSQRHKARVRSITDGGATVLSGSSEYAFNADTTQSISTISGVFTITTSKTFDIQHTFEVGSALGLGVNSSFGDAEVFTQVKITKIK
jgi:hypothetical protein